jgi:hypothetical protein
MRFLKAVGLVLCVFTAMAIAKNNSMGIHDVNHVRFESSVRIGSELLPAGDYVVRHTMEGQEHVMVFQKVIGKNEFKVKCTLVPLPRKASQDQSTFQVNASNEKVLQELQFSGDTAKHVF